MISFSYSQNIENQSEKNDQKQNEEIESNFYIELQILNPSIFGRHFLNQAYDQNNLGFGFYLNFMSFKNFNLGGGYSGFGSRLSDASLAGNFKRATYRTYYFQLSYELLKINNFNANASMGYGLNTLKQRTNNDRRGKYSTGELRTGLFLIYKFSKTTNFSLGANYLTTNKNVISSDIASDLFGRTHVLYTYLGIIFKF